MKPPHVGGIIADPCCATERRPGLSSVVGVAFEVRLFAAQTVPERCGGRDSRAARIFRPRLAVIPFGNSERNATRQDLPCTMLNTSYLQWGCRNILANQATGKRPDVQSHALLRPRRKRIFMASLQPCSHSSRRAGSKDWLTIETRHEAGLHSCL